MSPETEHTDPLGDAFKWRLRAQLNRVRPPYSSPRYLTPPRESTAGLRIATAVIAIAVVGTLSLTAYATTGSPNPAVWTRQIVTKIEPTLSSPSPIPADSPSPGAAPAVPAQQAPPTPRSEPSEQPAGTPSPEQEPGEDHSASGARMASPSPYGGDH